MQSIGEPLVNTMSLAISPDSNRVAVPMATADGFSGARCSTQ